MNKELVDRLNSVGADNNGEFEVIDAWEFNDQIISVEIDYSDHVVQPEIIVVAYTNNQTLSYKSRSWFSNYTGFFDRFGPLPKELREEIDKTILVANLTHT
jgi:hypothetical protein